MGRLQVEERDSGNRTPAPDGVVALDRRDPEELLEVPQRREKHDSTDAPRWWVPAKWRHYFAALAVVALCVLIGWGCFTLGLSDTNIVMIFLAGVALIAARFGHGPAIAGAVLGVLAFDYFFVHPSFAFAPTDAEYFITLSVMLGIGLLISELMARLQLRLRASQEAQQAQIQVQSEQLRNSLLCAVSHDLRTPLATIAVNASRLLEGAPEPTWEEKQELLQSVVDESHRLARQVDNLLDMARLDSGQLAIRRDWEVLEELVGVALARLRRELHAHVVHVSIPSEFPLLYVSGELIEQLLVNLLENAVRYTPPGSRIEIDAVHGEGWAEFRIWDNGPGLPPGSETRLFEKFVRGHAVVADCQRGIGLGLAICQAIVRAHGGQISAGPSLAGGALFSIALPCPAAGPLDTLNATSVQTVS